MLCRHHRVLNKYRKLSNSGSCSLVSSYKWFLGNDAELQRADDVVSQELFSF